MTGFSVDSEPQFWTSDGKLKPDLVVKKDGCVYIMNVAICSDGIDPDKVYSDEVSKDKPVVEVLKATYSDLKLSALVID